MMGHAIPNGPWAEWAAKRLDETIKVNGTAKPMSGDQSHREAPALSGVWFSRP
jgi:hypothetical protein